MARTGLDAHVLWDLRDGEYSLRKPDRIVLNARGRDFFSFVPACTVHLIAADDNDMT